MVVVAVPQSEQQPALMLNCSLFRFNRLIHAGKLG